MIQVGIYGEIQPEPSGNPLGSTLGISLVLRIYFTSRHNTDTIQTKITPCEERIYGKVLGSLPIQQKCLFKIEWVNGSFLSVYTVISVFCSFSLLCHPDLIWTANLHRLVNWYVENQLTRMRKTRQLASGKLVDSHAGNYLTHKRESVFPGIGLW